MPEIDMITVKESKSKMKILRCSKNAKRIYVPSDIGGDSQFPLDDRYNAVVSIVSINGELAILIRNVDV